jgi:hypothetical protein
MRKRRLITALALSLALAHLSGGMDAMAASPGAPPMPGHAGWTAMADRRAETAKIISALRGRVRDRVILRKTAHKLATLDDGQFRLIASLSERVAGGGGLAADVALLLLTALLILS